jgi:predicted RNase H-like nuclease (RuvC/YqgF family)
LKAELEHLISGNSDFGHSDNVVKLSHYNFSQGDLSKIKEQEAEIRRLEQLVSTNNQTIQNYKKASEELGTRMTNIQSIDREIYKTLQGSVNRDKELLDRASSALARGERREDIARILQQILG